MMLGWIFGSKALAVMRYPAIYLYISSSLPFPSFDETVTYALSYELQRRSIIGEG